MKTFQKSENKMTLIKYPLFFRGCHIISSVEHGWYRNMSKSMDQDEVAFDVVWLRDCVGYACTSI